MYASQDTSATPITAGFRRKYFKPHICVLCGAVDNVVVHSKISSGGVGAAVAYVPIPACMG